MSGKSKGIQETPQQAAMVQKATQQMEDYKARWLPLQKQMSNQIMALAGKDSGDRQRAIGRAAVESQAQFGQAENSVERSLTNAGRGPGSSAFKLGVTGLASDAGAAKGSTLTSANQAVDDAYIQGLGALTAIGRGEKASALQSESQLAAMSGRQAKADAAEAAAARGGNMQLAGTLIGYGLSSAMKPTGSPGVDTRWNEMYPAATNVGYAGPLP